MNQTIEKLLRDNYVDGIHHTHVSMVQPRGKYQFNRSNLELFWPLYNKEIEENNDFIVGIAEKPQNYLPVLVDIDLKLRDDNSDIERLYTDSHVLDVIQVYNDVLRNTVDSITDDNLLCIFLSKEPYRIVKNEISYIKNGFHLHYPNLFLNVKDQEVHIIPRVQAIIAERQIFQDMGFDNSGLLVDKACCKVPWLLYGSRKTEDSKPYKFTKAFNHKLEELDIENAFKNYAIYNQRETRINIRGKVNYYLPQILSIIPYGRSTKETRQGLISPLKDKKITEERKREYKSIAVSEALELAKKLLPILSVFRAEDRNEWMTIGWVLYNIGEGSSEAMDLWCEFSARSAENYDESGCIFQWERMTKKDLSIGTLKYFASVDNPDMYAVFKEEQIQQKVNDSLNGSHNDIAKVLFEEFGTEFICASIINKNWYQYKENTHIWQENEDGTYLRSRISNHIVKIYEKAAHKFVSGMSSGTEDRDEASVHQNRLNKTQKIIMNLKSSPFKNNIMRESMEVFYDRTFRNKLDTNPYLIAFKNGVYDLKLNIFRNGRPEDYLSKSMPIEYKDYTFEDREVQEVFSFLEKVFPDKSVRQYFMDMSSDVFVGGNHQKVVLFWTGEGDNGKSVTQSFFDHMLGPLAIKFNTTVVTGKKPSSGGTWADLARAGGGVRWATLEEPGNDEVINTGVLKWLSGNDTIYARELFEKGKDVREIVPMFKLVFICNKLPKLSYGDNATWNRIRVIPFESTFCKQDNPAPVSYEEQLNLKRFPMDKELSQRIPQLVQAFAWILLQHRLNITTRIEPDKVTSATSLYRRQNDVYRQFIEEYILEVPKSILTITELYNNFKDWYKDSLPHHNLPIKNEVKEYFIKLWGEPTRSKWIGYKIRTMDDEIILTNDDLVTY